MDKFKSQKMKGICRCKGLYHGTFHAIITNNTC